MGYEVYLSSNSVGSNSEKARSEYKAYSMTKRGSDRPDQRGRILPKGECFCILLQFMLLYVLQFKLLYCALYPCCLCKLLGLCYYAYSVGFMVCTLLNAAFYALF